jgi:hypothetical protein
MELYIILIMQHKNFEPIAFVEYLCVCNDDGNVAIFPDLKSATDFSYENSIDGKIVKLPIY